MNRAPHPTLCHVDGCSGTAKARRLCAKHYERWRRQPTNLLEGLSKLPKTAESFWSRVDRSGGPSACWAWLGTILRTGYGNASHPLGDGCTLSHRAAWAWTHGSLPEDPLQLDHICHTNDTSCRGGTRCQHRRCVNPTHLEVVTPLVNTHRSNAISAKNAVKTHCIRNHPFDAANTRITPEGFRRCRRCHAEYMLTWNKRSAA